MKIQKSDLMLKLVESKREILKIEELKRKFPKLKNEEKIKGDKKYFIITYNEEVIGFVDSYIWNGKFIIRHIFLLKIYNKEDFENAILLHLYDYTIPNKLVLAQKKYQIMELFLDIVSNLLIGLSIGGI